MAKRILLQYHIWEREYMILDILKQQLEKYDVIVEYGDYMDMGKCLEFCPDIIVTHPIRTNTDTCILSTMKLATGAVLIPMTVEGYYDLDNLQNVLRMVGTDPCPADLIDYFIMWGEKNRNIEGLQLLAFNKLHSLEQIKVFGYIPYEKDKILEYSKATDCYDGYLKWKNNFERIIVCVTGFIFAENTIDNLRMEKTFTSNEGSEAYNKEVEYYERLIEFQKKYRDQYVNDIIQLARQCSNIGVAVKLHPVEIKLLRQNKLVYYEKLRGYNNILLVDTPFPLSVILNDAELLVHYGSTTSLEAYIFGVPTLLRSADGYLTGNKNMYLYTDEVCIYDFNTFAEKIKNGIAFQVDKKMEDVLFDSFNWRKDAPYHPSEQIAEFLNNDLHAKRVNIKELLKNEFVIENYMRGVRTCIYKSLLQALLHADFKQAKKYFKYIFRLLDGICTVGIDLKEFFVRRISRRAI